MPDFVNPFSGITPPRKMTDSELLRALRLDLAAEEEAVHLYMAHADATDNELAKKVLKDVADEERQHIGEFQRLINILSSEEEKLLAEGMAEVEEMVQELRTLMENKTSEENISGTVRSIGNLKE